jgi:flotillin
MIATQQAEVQAMIAQATGEVQMQEARIEQVRRKLQADILQPADAERRRAEERAKGDASQIIEQGRATALVLTEIAATYQGSGASGRDVLLMQKLVPLLRSISGTIGDLKIDRFTVIPPGIGGGSGGEGSVAGKIVNYAEQIKAATGIDVPGLVRDRLGDGDKRPQQAPPPRR